MLALTATFAHALTLPRAAASRSRIGRALVCCRSSPQQRLWSPSDLTLFAESPWASWLERLAREEPAHPWIASADQPDAFLELLGRKGEESEAAVLRALRRAIGGGDTDAGDRLVDLSGQRGAAEERVAATRAALASGPAVIYQAPLMGGGFFGVADFLVRVDGGPSAPARYMVWDAKLGRQPRPAQVLQLCCYAEMLAELQGAPVERVGLILGSTPLVLRVSAYGGLYRRTRARFLAAQAVFEAAGQRVPAPPDPRMPAGRWGGLAASELLRRDDLRLVARLSRRQAARLRGAGVGTSTALAELSASRLPEVAGMPPAVVRRLARQAALQLHARAAPHAPPPFELLGGACAPTSGLGALPRPHAADCFFDLEGYPFASLPATSGEDGGLPDLLRLSSVNEAHVAVASANGASRAGGGREYLWGISTRPGSTGHVSAAEVAHDGTAAADEAGDYHTWWAHDAVGERAAFAGAVDWICERLAAHPTMHVSCSAGSGHSNARPAARPILSPPPGRASMAFFLCGPSCPGGRGGGKHTQRKLGRRVVDGGRRAWSARPPRCLRRLRRHLPHTPATDRSTTMGPTRSRPYAGLLAGMGRGRTRWTCCYALGRWSICTTWCVVRC